MFDVIIVGGASAGLTAALYASRQGLKTLVVTKDISGQAVLTPHIENFPGFESIGGLELMEKLQQQATSFGAEFRYEEAVEIKGVENWFEVKTPMGVYQAMSLILAFGKTPRDLGVPGEAKLVGRGVSYCVVCDAPLFKGKAVAVVGWGEPAMDAAMMLCPIAAKVYLVYKGSTLVGHEELVNRCQREGVMEAVANSEVLEVKGGSKVEGLIIRNLKDDQTSELNVQGVFVEMGYVAKTGFVKDLVTLNTVGEIMVAKDQSTSHPGIFAAGDVTDTPFKQAIISAGEGAKAALSAYNYLQRIRGKPLARSDWKVLIK